MTNFNKGENRNQLLLLPPSISQYIDDKHLAKIILKILDKLDLSEIERTYSIIGRKAYCPKIMLSLLIYGYSTGTVSSRDIELACKESLPCKFLSAGLTPSHKSISEFRRLNLEIIRDKFKDVVLLAIKLGLARLGKTKISIDGTKIRANASSKNTKDVEGLLKLHSKIEKEVDKLLAEAEKMDNKEDLLERAEKRNKKIKAAKNSLLSIEEALQELRAEKEAIKKNFLDRGKTITKKIAQKIEKKKINITDIEAAFMKERKGCTTTCYNAQASVDEDSQIILAVDVVNEPNDQNQLINMVNRTKKIVGNSISEVKADSGYNSIKNLKGVSKLCDEYYINDSNINKINNEKYKFNKVNFKYDKEENIYICPCGKKLYFEKEYKKDGTLVSAYRGKECLTCPFREECIKSKSKSICKTIIRQKDEDIIEENRAKLMTEEGRKKYVKRMHTVEPIFGDIKHNKGFKQFLLRGLEKVKGEFSLLCMSYNIKKIAKFVKKKGLEILENLNLNWEMA